MRRLLLLALLLLPASAAGQGILRNAVDDLKHGGSDILWIWSSPVRIDVEDLPTLGGVLAVGAALAVADESIQEWVVDHQETAVVQVFDPFREDEPGEDIGDVWLYLRGSGVAWLTGLVLGSETTREAAMGCAASAIAQGVARRYAVYTTIRRTRPRFTDDAHEWDVPGTREWEGRSFFGGHAANAITCIAFWNTRYDLGWAEPLLYGAAIGVGIARVVDEAHWTSDTFLGLVFGYAIGRNVALRSRDRARKAAEEAGRGDGEAGYGRADRRIDVSVTTMTDGAPALTWSLRF